MKKKLTIKNQNNAWGFDTYGKDGMNEKYDKNSKY